MIENLTINIFYGVKISKHDYENFQKKHGLINFYGKLYENELSFGEIGEVGFSWEQVIGFRIVSEMTNVLSIDNEGNGFNIVGDDAKFQLPIDTEQEIRNKLLSLGITSSPSYHIFCSWETSNK